MQQYRSLFNESAQPAKLARQSDPITSHEAASRIESARSETQQRCLDALSQSPVPLCANRLATRCCEVYGCDGTADQRRKIWDNYRKRANEIFRTNEMIEPSGKQHGAMTFRVKGQR